MLQIGNTIVHLDIIFKCFACNLNKCYGICCVAGDSGAPLEKDEAKKIKKLIPKIFDELLPDAKKIVKEKGGSLIDFENDLTTTTLENNGACVFTQYDENKNAYCLIEKAYEKGLTDFRKPISCHLYPIRTKRYDSFDAVNYHEWQVCKDAVTLGNEKSVPVYVFLKDALICKYGKEWYDELCLAARSVVVER